MKIDKVKFTTTDKDELLNLINNYFIKNKMEINSQLMLKAIKLAELYGYFNYISVKICGEYNVIYITHEDILNTIEKDNIQKCN